MDPERWRKLEEIFQAARGMEPREREGFLAEVCGLDPSLRVEVEALLGAREESETFLATPALGSDFHLEAPGSPGGGPRRTAAAELNDRAISLRAEGRIDEAVAAYDRVIRMRVRLVEEEGHADLRRGLADAYNNRGVAHDDQGNTDRAIDDYDGAIGIYRRLIEEEGRVDLRSELAMALTNRAISLRELGRLGDALEDSDRAVEIRTALVDDEGRRDLREELAGSLNTRATLRRDRGETREALRDYDRAIALYGRLVAEGRDDLSARLAKTRRLRMKAASR